MPYARSLNKGDIIETSVNVLNNTKNIKAGNYLATNKDDPKLSVTSDKTENVIGLIHEHIVVKYTFKEVWDLFIKFLFKTPKINNVRFEIID